MNRFRIENDRGGTVTILMDDGAVVLSDHSNDVPDDLVERLVRQANAAPDLVAACDQALRQIENGKSPYPVQIELMRAAIAKALGG